MQRNDERQQRRWAITMASEAVPYEPDEPLPTTLPHGVRALTVRQIADASGLDPDLIRRRLREQRIRDWVTLTRSPAAAKAAQVARNKRVMAGERDAALGESARRTQLAMRRTIPVR